MISCHSIKSFPSIISLNVYTNRLNIGLNYYIPIKASCLNIKRTLDLPCIFPHSRHISQNFRSKARQKFVLKNVLLSRNLIVLPKETSPEVRVRSAWNMLGEKLNAFPLRILFTPTLINDVSKTPCWLLRSQINFHSMFVFSAPTREIALQESKNVWSGALFLKNMRRGQVSRLQNDECLFVKLSLPEILPSTLDRLSPSGRLGLLLLYNFTGVLLSFDVFCKKFSAKFFSPKDFDQISFTDVARFLFMRLKSPDTSSRKPLVILSFDMLPESTYKPILDEIQALIKLEEDNPEYFQYKIKYSFITTNAVKIPFDSESDAFHLSLTAPQVTDPFDNFFIQNFDSLWPLLGLFPKNKIDYKSFIDMFGQQPKAVRNPLLALTRSHETFKSKLDYVFMSTPPLCDSILLNNNNIVNSQHQRQFSSTSSQKTPPTDQPRLEPIHLPGILEHLIKFGLLTTNSIKPWYHWQPLVNLICNYLQLKLFLWSSVYEKFDTYQNYSLADMLSNVEWGKMKLIKFKENDTIKPASRNYTRKNSRDNLKDNSRSSTDNSFFAQRVFPQLKDVFYDYENVVMVPLLQFTKSFQDFRPESGVFADALIPHLYPVQWENGQFYECPPPMRSPKFQSSLYFTRKSSSPYTKTTERGQLKTDSPSRARYSRNSVNMNLTQLEQLASVPDYLSSFSAPPKSPSWPSPFHRPTFLNPFLSEYKPLDDTSTPSNFINTTNTNTSNSNSSSASDPKYTEPQKKPFRNIQTTRSIFRSPTSDSIAQNKSNSTSSKASYSTSTPQNFETSHVFPQSCSTPIPTNMSSLNTSNSPSITSIYNRVILTHKKDKHLADAFIIFDGPYPCITFIKILEEYDSIDNVYNRIAEWEIHDKIMVPEERTRALKSDDVGNQTYSSLNQWNLIVFSPQHPNSSSLPPLESLPHNMGIVPYDKLKPFFGSLGDYILRKNSFDADLSTQWLLETAFDVPTATKIAQERSVQFFASPEQYRKTLMSHARQDYRLCFQLNEVKSYLESPMPESYASFRFWVSSPDSLTISPKNQNKYTDTQSSSTSTQAAGKDQDKFDVATDPRVDIYKLESSQSAPSGLPSHPFNVKWMDLPIW